MSKVQRNHDALDAIPSFFKIFDTLVIFFIEELEARAWRDSAARGECGGACDAQEKPAHAPGRHTPVRVAPPSLFIPRILFYLHF